MKNTIIKGMSVLACFAFIACGQNEKKKEEFAPKEKYCGVELTGFEVLDLKNVLKNQVPVSAADEALNQKLVNNIDSLTGGTQQIGMRIFYKDKDKVSMYVQGPDDAAVTEKVCCYLLGAELDTQLPKQRNVLYYTEKSDNIVAGIKSK